MTTTEQLPLTFTASKGEQIAKLNGMTYSVVGSTLRVYPSHGRGEDTYSATFADASTARQAAQYWSITDLQSSRYAAYLRLAAAGVAW